MTLEEFAARLQQSKDIVFFTGAGISTESGVPDFRSPGGIWTKYAPVYFDDFLRSREARVRYWKMKAETIELYKNVAPNSGHFSIKAFEERDQLLGVITQNVDGLHRIAGVSEEKIVELHGTDRKVACPAASGNSTRTLSTGEGDSGVRSCNHTFHRTLSVEFVHQTIGTKSFGWETSPGDDAGSKM